MTDVASRLADALRGQYEILREVGRGGMATVFAARDLKHNRAVAIKLLDLPGAGAAERFQREIQLVARLRHPHIVPLYDSGRSGELCYYVMPLFDGQTLRDRLRERGPLALDDVSRITAEVADALDHAHEQGVIHRDVKPENIHLEGAHATVTDFGIARSLVAGDGGADTDLTVTGVIVGTPSYMSPEQISGARDLDGRSDEYSLACVAYEMLAGRPPFQGTPGRAVHVQHLSDVAPSIGVSRPNLPAHFDAVLQRALSKDPVDRFPTTREFAAALAGRQFDAPRLPAARLPRRFALLAAAAAVIVAAAGLAWSTSRGRRDAQSPSPGSRVSVAVLPLDNLSDDPANAYFSDGVLEDLLVALNRVPRLNVAPRTSSFRFRGKGLSLRAIAESLHVTNVVEGSVRREGSTIRIAARLVHMPTAATDSTLWAGDFTREMKNILAVQGEMANVIASRLLVSLLPADRAALAARPAPSAEAYDRYLKGRFYWNQRTAPALLQAARFFHEALSIDSGYALAYAGLADTYTLLPWTGAMRPVDARPMASAAATRALTLDSLLPGAHVSAGIVRLFFDWDYATAHGEFQRAIALDSTSSQAWLFDTWALSSMGQLDKALASVQRAQQLDPLALVVNARVGTLLVWLRRYAEAEASLRRTLEIDPGFPMTRMELARALALEGKLGEAVGALTSSRLMLGSQAAGIPGFVFARAGRIRDARLELAQLERQPIVAFDALAAVYVALGDRDAALRALDRAVEEHNISVPFINVEPMFDSLHGDPRFERIIRRLGLR